MVQAICMGISDTSVLVQRNALDLLIVAFPLHESTLEEQDISAIVTAACCVLLRRDMSLNRRLFNWLLGSDVVKERLSGPKGYDRTHMRSASISSTASSTDSTISPYFDYYSKSVLIEALRAILRNSLRSDEQPDLKPYRLLTTLLDKPEIGPVVIDNVIIDIFRTLYHSFHNDRIGMRTGKKGAIADEEKKKIGRPELIKSANLLFATFESHYIWSFCGDQFEAASENQFRISDYSVVDVNNIGTEESTIVEMCALIEFLLDVVSIETYVETYSEHLPELFKKIMGVACEKCSLLTPIELTKALKLSRRILSKIQPAWNVWDAQDTVPSTGARGGAVVTSTSEGETETATSCGETTNNEEESANEMWNKIGKNHLEDSQPCDTDTEGSPEIGREVTESLPVSPCGQNFQSSPQRSKKKHTSAATKLHQAHEQLMIECSRIFEDFFVQLMSVHIFPENFNAETHLMRMVRRPHDTLEQRTRWLECLMEEKTNSGSSSNANVSDGMVELEEEARIEKLKDQELPLRPDTEGFEPAVIIACKILVDLSSIPTVSSKSETASSVEPSESVNSLYGCAPTELPKWLQYLLLSSSLLPKGQPGLQLQCIGTLLETIGLLQSTITVARQHRRSLGGGPQSDSNIVIVMMPLIREQHYQCLMKQTIIPQVVTARLWDGLGLMEPVYHLKCVTLLHQLHNIVPVPNTVERILARSLGYGPVTDEENKYTVDAYQRFTLLWHLSRDLEAKSGTKQVKTFDICLLKMLDNLNLSSGPLKALSQSWLVHAMARGDIARLMEPLFVTLLDPSTARVSVLHAKIELLEDQVRQGVEGQDNGASGLQEGGGGRHRIYAISSSNGEIIYHISEMFSSRSESDKTKKLFALNKFQNSRCNSGNALSDQKDHQHPTSLKLRAPSSDQNSQSDLASLNLMVNPFALVPHNVEGYDFFTRGYNAISSSSSSSVSSSTASPSVSGPPSSSSLSMSKLFGDPDEDRADTSKETIKAAIAKVELPPKKESSNVERKVVSIHPLHSHLLMYCQVSDSQQILYTMSCIKNMIQTNSRLAIFTLSTTNLSSSGASSARNNQIQMLLARHRKSVFGKNFVGSIQSENLATYRNSSLVEVLISTLLYYLRSYYPNLGQVRLSEEEIQSNREVQLMSIDILAVLVSELVLVVQDNGKPYAVYIADLFSRCKVQKVVLHSLLAGINDMRDRPKAKDEEEAMAFTEDILDFNEINSTHEKNGSSKISNYSEAFQVQVLRLLLSLVMLEQSIHQQRGDPEHKHKQMESAGLASLSSSGRSTPASYSQGGAGGGHNILRYHADHVIPDQPMFLAAIVTALKQEKMRHLHSHWTSLVTSCLPFLGKSLSQTVLEVSSQLSRNLELLAPFYMADQERDSSLGKIPADYIVTQLEALTMIYHYCLLDSASQVSPSFTQSGGGGQSGSSGSGTAGGSPSGANSGSHGSSQNGEILNNLLHVFLSNTDTKNLAAKSLGTMSNADTLAIARKILLATLPRLVNTIAVLWSCLNRVKKVDSSCSILAGAPKTVRKQLLDFVSPIAQLHSVQFLSAIGVAWQERKSLQSPGMLKHPLPVCNDEQRVLVELAGSINTMPVATVIGTVRQVLKSAPSVNGSKINVEVSVLQFFYAYLAQCSATQVFESWSSLSGLLRDCLALAPPAIFLALSILNQFVHRSPTLSDRKEQKELQDVAGKLIDACAQIGGSCLEQTTWLRRNLAVNADLQVDLDKSDMMDLSESSTKLSDTDSVASMSTTTSSAAGGSSSRKAMTQYAVPALALLGELLAPLLDIIYNSEEKDKVVPLLYSVMTNVIPYLRNHCRSNLGSFRACSRLLASLSEYQYTRKAWKKEGMELLLDPTFFQVDLESLKHWVVTVDNLMTHDKTTFKELISKCSLFFIKSSKHYFSLCSVYTNLIPFPFFLFLLQPKYLPSPSPARLVCSRARSRSWSSVPSS